MAYDIVIPRLGLTMETGRIVEWFKKDGDPVAAGELLFAIETDKAVQDIPAEVSGTVHQIPNQSTEPLPIGTVIGHILQPGEGLASQASTASSFSAASKSTKAAAPSSQQAPPFTGKRLVSPAARRRARELGLDIKSLESMEGAPITAGQIEQASHTQALRTVEPTPSVQPSKTAEGVTAREDTLGGDAAT